MFPLIFALEVLADVWKALHSGRPIGFADDFVEANLQAEFHNYEMPLCGVDLNVTYHCFTSKGTGRWPGRLKAAPSPSHSPCRMAGQSATCNTPAKDFPDLWSGRRCVASQRWHKVQESLYGHRPWQVSDAAPLRSAAAASFQTAFSRPSRKPRIQYSRRRQTRALSKALCLRSAAA